MRPAKADHWRIAAVVLSVISAGAYLGNESAHYFWDLASYVDALDSPFPYREQRTYPFLYPPFTVDVFTLARSHLFELLSIGYVGAGAFFLWSYARLDAPRKYEWLFAATAIGGLGVVSLQSGNLAILMNLALLGVLYVAAGGELAAIRLLPVVIGIGALLKPQFIIYLPLVVLVARHRRLAVIRAVLVMVGVAAVYGGYVVMRPGDWQEYVQAVLKRTVVEKDYAWGPAGLVKHWNDSAAAAALAYVAGLLVAGALSWLTWRRSPRMPLTATASLCFIVLTFANPRLPLYDVFAVFIALGVCCSMAARQGIMVRLLALLLAVNLVPWLIREFARTPSAWAWWLQDPQFGHLLALVSLLFAVSRVGIADDGNPERAL